ncbi:MAG: hypothetical protein WKF56_05075, partial [Candidatus Limnocylindrales bacterium]
MDAELPILLALAAVIALAGVLTARTTSLRLGWAAAGPFLLVAATPLIPNYSVLAGFSLDDVLPLTGVLLMLPLLPWRSIRGSPRQLVPGPTIALLGIVLMILAGAVSALLNGSEAADLIRLAIRGSGRLLFLLAVAVSAATLGASPLARRFSGHAIALVGTFEAAFGLVAYFVGLPLQAGLEAVIKSSVLYGAVPGRISGTIGNSPNFTGALFIITTLITAGLALQALERRTSIVWWLAVIGQLAAL